VTRQDYYALYGIFASSKYSFPGSEEKKRPYDLAPLVPPAEAAEAKTRYDAALATLAAEIKTLSESPGSTPKEEIAKQLAQKNQAKSTLEATGPYDVAYAVMEGAPKNARIHKRGEPADLGEEVPRRFLDILGKDPLANAAASGRLELAEWLVRPENPLTARVMVNRVWQHHFGTGLVSTTNDFGSRGIKPLHAELLDYLAARFRDEGWSIKSLHRLMMNSRAYQLASKMPSRCATACWPSAAGSIRRCPRPIRSRRSASGTSRSMLHSRPCTRRAIGACI
jgi:hypothetical protein